MSSVDPCLQNLKKMFFDRLALAAAVHPSQAPHPPGRPDHCALLNKDQNPDFRRVLFQSVGKHPEAHGGCIGMPVWGQGLPVQQIAEVGLSSQPRWAGAAPELRARGR